MEMERGSGLRVSFLAHCRNVYLIQRNSSQIRQSSKDILQRWINEKKGKKEKETVKKVCPSTHDVIAFSFC